MDQVKARSYELESSENEILAAHPSFFFKSFFLEILGVKREYKTLKKTKNLHPQKHDRDCPKTYFKGGIS